MSPGGEGKTRVMWLVQNVAEGNNSYVLSWKEDVMIKRKQNETCEQPEMP